MTGKVPYDRLVHFARIVSQLIDRGGNTFVFQATLLPTVYPESKFFCVEYHLLHALV